MNGVFTISVIFIFKNKSMKLTFVNHSSLVFSYDGINLITDPWLEGAVFHDGWSLISETKFSYSDFEKITHIWFSHEHPDHFFPPNIKSIPQEFREKITILYQKTKDRKVVEFCEKLNFKQVIELVPNNKLRLTENFEVTCTPYGHDSWLYIKTDLFSFLNTNDCVINTVKDGENLHNITGDVDVLLTQFSYASKHGNYDQPNERIKAANKKYEEIKLQFEIFNPKYFVPIASFIWYSHEENFYMNDNANKIDQVYNFSLSNKVEPIILYPSNEHVIGEKHNNKNSISKYNSDYKKITIENTKKTISCSLNEIKLTTREILKRSVKKDFFSIIVLSFFPVKFHLTDLDVVVKFSSLSGLKQIMVDKHESDISLTSEVLNYCLKFYWGFNTLSVNGRCNTNDKGKKKLGIYMAVFDSLNHNEPVLKRAFKKITRTIKSYLKKFRL
jgi:UDP-MurNAc hydroxylase